MPWEEKSPRGRVTVGPQRALGRATNTVSHVFGEVAYRLTTVTKCAARGGNPQLWLTFSAFLFLLEK